MHGATEPLFRRISSLFKEFCTTIFKTGICFNDRLHPTWCWARNRFMMTSLLCSSGKLLFLTGNVLAPFMDQISSALTGRDVGGNVPVRRRSAADPLPLPLVTAAAPADFSPGSDALKSASLLCINRDHGGAFKASSPLKLFWCHLCVIGALRQHSAGHCCHWIIKIAEVPRRKDMMQRRSDRHWACRPNSWFAVRLARNSDRKGESKTHYA
jgi:hypothetical protein